MENVERLPKSLASAPNEIFDVVDSQSPDHMLHSNGNVDHLVSCPKVLPELDQQNGESLGGGVCLVVDNLVSETDGLEVSDGTNGKSAIESGGGVCLVDNLVSETDGPEVSDGINGISMIESANETAAKRIGDDIMPESDEQQPSKRLRLSNDLHL